MLETARRQTSSPGGQRNRPGRYRADLDGLRAVAVAAVVLFHYGFDTVSGGFVGVDVFFVISGFLITAIVWGEFDRASFSIVSFYERRLRRILPALSAMLLVCGAAFFFVFLPEDMRLLAKSEASAAVFATNILFQHVASDYFDADNLTLQPLLHTWSLAVEAQFYLVYPWFLLLLRGRRGRAVAVMATVAALSFALCLWGTAHHPVATFYLLPGRAWELLLGGLLTLGVRGRDGAGRAVGAGPAGLATLAGLAAILVAAFSFDASTPFPGMAALLPCVGAVLVIFGGSHPNAASAWLGSRPVAALGRISYSLYLWHWPVLVLTRYGASAEPALETRLLMLVGTLALASLSYVAIERPFIARAALPSRRALFAAAVATVGATVALGGVLDLTGRGVLPFAQLPPAVLTLANGHFDRSEGDCDPPSDGSPPACRFGDPQADPTIAVWGNSYARMWTPALDEEGRRHAVSGVEMLMGKCPPLLDVSVAARPTCAEFNRASFAYLEAHPSLRTVLLGADWFVYGADLNRLAETLEALKQSGVSVVVLLAPPQADYMVPRTLALAALRGAPPPPPIDRAHARVAQQASVDLIARLQERFGFRVIDPATVLCDATLCPVERGGRPVFYDAGHVTASAALASAALFEPLFDAAAAAPTR